MNPILKNLLLGTAKVINMVVENNEQATASTQPTAPRPPGTITPMNAISLSPSEVDNTFNVKAFEPEYVVGKISEGDMPFVLLHDLKNDKIKSSSPSYHAQEEPDTNGATALRHEKIKT